MNTITIFFFYLNKDKKNLCLNSYKDETIAISFKKKIKKKSMLILYVR